MPEVYPVPRSRALVWLNALAPGFCDRVVKKFGRKPRHDRMHRAMRPLERDRIADAVRDAGGRALIVGGWVRDRLLGRDVQGHRPRGLRRAGRPAAAAARGVRPRRDGRRELSGLQGRRHRRVAAAPRIEIRTRPSRLRRHRRSDDDDRGRRAAARLHGQRDRLGSADRRVSRSVRRPRRSRAGALLRVVDPATFADDSLRVLRAVQFAARFDFALDDATRALCRTIPLDDLPAERVWGEIEKLLFAPRPSIGFALAMDLGVVVEAVSGAAGARRLPAGARVASRGRRLGAHAAGHRPGADAHRRSAAAAADRHDARRRLPRLRQAGDDGVHRRPHPIDRSRGAGRRAAHRRFSIGSTSARSTATTCGSRSLGLVAQHLKPGMWFKVRERGRRRRVPPARAESGPRAARARREGRLPRPRAGPFDCAAMDWFLERARSLGVEHRPPAPMLLGRHLLALGLTPGPRVGEVLKAVYEQQLDGTVQTLDDAIASVRRLIDSSDRHAGPGGHPGGGSGRGSSVAAGPPRDGPATKTTRGLAGRAARSRVPSARRSSPATQTRWLSCSRRCSPSARAGTHARRRRRCAARTPS